MPRKATILVVDDEPHVVRLVQANLQASGYQVLTAGNGGTALEIIEARQPDLVLLDVMMPGLDGLEVARRLPTIEALDTLRVVSVTSSPLRQSLIGIIPVNPSHTRSCQLCGTDPLRTERLLICRDLLS